MTFDDAKSIALPIRCEYCDRYCGGNCTGARYDGVDKSAEDFIGELADMFADDSGNRVTRFTPSIKMGRRYLNVERGGKRFRVIVDVENVGASYPIRGSEA